MYQDSEGTRGRIVLGEIRDRDGHGCMARMAIAVVDGRPVALIFPASRRVVLERLGKLLGADEVRLADRDEVDDVAGRRGVASSRAVADSRRMSVLMDASLLSARSLEIAPDAEGTPLRLTIEDWLATANPGLGFFTEPDAASSVRPPRVATIFPEKNS
jgi:prolyl-tRNA editing enzyme YbaK/EbsC (Cys-tRNA(Pro) deacylase)